MRVLVYEPKFVGHFLGFAAAAARAFAELGIDVTLGLSSHAEDSAPAKIKLQGLPEKVEVRFGCDVPKLYKKWSNARLEARGLESFLRAEPFDWLVVPSADFLVPGLVLDRGVHRLVSRLGGVDLVLHNCRAAYPQVGLREWPEVWFDRLAATIASRHRLLTVDEYVTSGAAPGRIGLVSNPVTRLPHFFDCRQPKIEQAEARKRLGLATDAAWIGSAGDLGRRKGTELLIDGFAQSCGEGDTRLALFGLLSASAKAALEKHASLVEQGRIVTRDRYVTDEEFTDFFPAMDVVWTGYPRQVGMASTLLFAADSNRPVIAVDYGGVGWTVREYQLGVVCRPDGDSVASAIRSSLRDKASPAGAERFLTQHTTAAFNEVLTAGVRQRIGAMPEDGEP
ncbi:MAG: glycosyltransferase [Planctomycetota bacterium]